MVFFFFRNSFFIVNFIVVKIKLIYILKKYIKNVEYIVLCIYFCFVIDVIVDILDDMY